jgi:GNAT superfamily N-acetyltransferase
MIISPLTAHDFAGWAPLWAGYLDFYRAAVDAETTAVTFERLLDPAEPMGGFLAFDDDGAAIGMAHWIDHRSCWTRGDYCYLQDLYVRPETRGGGVGRALIAAVADAARARGCSRLHWLTHETNQDAARLYDRVATRSGFIQYRQIF